MRIGSSGIRAACALIVSALVVAAFSACTPEPPEDIPQGPPWVDVLFDQDPKVLRTMNFADQTFLGLTLTYQEPSTSLPTALDHPTSLYLSGGYGRRAGRETKGGMLQFSLADGDTTVREGRIELPSGQPWWEKTIDLPTSPKGAFTLKLEAEVPKGHTVYVRHARISQMVPENHNATGGPQMILVSIDTLREDAIGVYGGPWHTPVLDALAAEGQKWAPSYSGAGWTKPSHATMLTGYRGDTHEMSGEETVLNPGITTLAERFNNGGLATGGFVNLTKWLDSKWGFGRGFDTYRMLKSRTDRAVYQAANWVAAHREESFFLFFHTFAVHSDWHQLPYESPDSTVERVAEEFGVEDYGCNEGKRCASLHLIDLNDRVIEPLPNEVEILRSLYGREVEETDRQLGVFFDELRRLGVWENTLLVVTSDHGEAFLEHGRFLHGHPWNEIARVPLIIKWPDGWRAGSAGAYKTGSMDIAPTLLKHAGLDFGDLPGIPLQDLDHERPVMIGGPNRILVTDGWKANLNGSLRRVTFLSKTEEDPWETTDLTDQYPEQAKRLQQMAKEMVNEDISLREALNVDFENATSELTPEEIEQLKALGYLH